VQLAATPGLALCALGPGRLCHALTLAVTVTVTVEVAVGVVAGFSSAQGIEVGFGLAAAVVAVVAVSLGRVVVLRVVIVIAVAVAAAVSALRVGGDRVIIVLGVGVGGAVTAVPRHGRRACRVILRRSVWPAAGHRRGRVRRQAAVQACRRAAEWVGVQRAAWTTANGGGTVADFAGEGDRRADGQTSRSMQTPTTCSPANAGVGR
jgi:hypothetical protein